MQKIFNFFAKFKSNKFTNENLKRIAYYSNTETVYATDKGNVYCYNYKTNTSSLIASISGENEEVITTIDVYQGICVIGTQSGKIFYIQHINLYQCPQQPKLILQLSSDISNLDIFQTGGYRVLYIATYDGSIVALIREKKSSSQNISSAESSMRETSTSQSSHPLSVIQSLQNSCEFENESLGANSGLTLSNPQTIQKQVQHSNTEINQQNIVDFVKFDSENFIIKRQIKFVGEHGRYMHAKSQILCYCSEYDNKSGVIRFFNQMNGAMIWKQEVCSPPKCCQMQYMHYKGHNTLVCHVGLDKGFIIRFNVHNKTQHVLNFYILKQQQSDQERQHKIYSQQQQLNQTPDSTNTQELILQANENVNTLIQHINMNNLDTPENHSEIVSEISYVQSQEVEEFKFEHDIHALWYLDGKIFVSDLQNVYTFEKIILANTNQKSFKLIDVINIPKGANRVEFVELKSVLQFHAVYNKGGFLKAEYVQESKSWNVVKVGL